jgi:protein tyrosine phosphatase domain-containing protein 1
MDLRQNKGQKTFALETKKIRNLEQHEDRGTSIVLPELSSPILQLNRPHASLFINSALSSPSKSSTGQIHSAILKGEHTSKSQQGSPQLTKGSFKKKQKFQCMFCGGKTCKHENYLNNKNSVVKGLESDWITDDLLAMQRPSSRIIKEFDIINQFKTLNIQTVINVQEPGEHPYCGDGIHKESGFSYFPEEFSDHGIYFYTLGWQDLTATEFTHMLKIMDIMTFSLQNGQKAAVHCHAGRGRTILVIASWMIYHNGMSAKDVIKHCASKREGVLSKDKQKKFLIEFEQYLIRTKKIFQEVPSQNIDELMKAQKTLINSEKSQLVRYYPLILHETLGKLKK